MSDAHTCDSIPAPCPKCRRIFMLPPDWPRGEMFICDNCLNLGAFNESVYTQRDGLEERLIEGIARSLRNSDNPQTFIHMGYS